MKLPERQRLPPLEQIPGLPYRGSWIPPISLWPLKVWLILLAVAAPIALVPMVGLARYTTTGPDFCLSCHALGDTPDRGVRSLVHPDQKVVCADCHAKPGQVVFEGYVKGFMAEPERISPNCVRCHPRMADTSDQDGFKHNLLDIRIPHRLHTAKGATCTTCHANVAHDSRVPQTNRPRMEACYQCHTVTESCTTCHRKNPPAGKVPMPAPVPLAGMADGRVLYMRTCSGCHGPRGDWVGSANLRSGEFLGKRSDEQLARRIGQGGGAMPGFGKGKGGDLTDDQVKAIVGYLRITQGTPATSNAQALFQSNCIKCHGAAGDSIPAANLSSREFLDGLGRATLHLAVAGGKGAMPAFGRDRGGPLQAEEVRAVVDYLWTISSGPGGSGGDGKTLYGLFCAACHGQNGGLIPEADLAKASFLQQRTDAELTQVTTEGRGVMPGFGGRKGQLTSDQIAAVVGYLRSVAK